MTESRTKALYARLGALGMNIEALKEADLSAGELEEFCNAIEDLLKRHRRRRKEEERT
ncbi:MAG: hypothetical protein ABI348_02950 [Nitrososphaera sp.]|jgi:7,8-dihydro-6-hydroxymethylpterin-pyrophosphokinase